MFSPPEDITPFRKHILPLFLMAVGMGLIYFNSLNAAFFLDDMQVADRPNLRISELSVASLKGTFYWTPSSKKIYRPLPCLTLGLNYYFGGDNPFGYHVVNVAIHFLCSLSVYLFILKLLSIPGIKPSFAAENRYQIAVIASLLFAFHPIQTNVATYVIQRMTSMAALFYVVSMIGYLSFRMKTLEKGEGGGAVKYVGAAVCIVGGAFSFMSKENSAILPVTILLSDYVLFYPLADEPGRARLRRIYGVSILLMLGVLAYAGPKSMLFFLKAYKGRDFTLMERLLTQPRVVFFYLYLILIPNVGLLNFNHDYPTSTGLLDPPQTLGAIVGIGILLFLAILFRRKSNLFCMAIIWFLGNLVIESSIIPLEMVFEHRTYLPGVAVFLILSLGIVYLCKEVLKKDKAILATSLLLILYGNGTVLRNVVFSTRISLWLDVVEKSPNLARAHANLGIAYMDAGQHQKAMTEYQIAHKLKPTMVEPMINLGKLYIYRLGQEEKAIEMGKKALRQGTRSFYVPMLLGNAYFRQKNLQKAEHFYRLALKRWAFFVPAINALGVVKIHMGKKQEGVNLLKYGLGIDARDETLNTNLARYYADERQFSKAIAVLEKYLAINQNSRGARKLLNAVKKKAAAKSIGE
jgi:tetratricopeptide (TPR) repeat protein